MSELESIVSTLGEQRTANVLQKILPVITARSDALLESVQQQNWGESARLAHTLLATANLFAPETLLDQLKMIEREDVTLRQKPDFAAALQQQLHHSLEELQKFSSEC